MIDNYLLEELVTFAQTGTLAQTAAALNVTQPTVTRGMQKLEDDLGVRLFNRQPNRILLTTTGELAVAKAKTLLALNRELVTTVQNFDRSQQRLILSSTLPGPLLVARKIQAQFPTLQLDDQLLPTDQLSDQLTSRAATLVLSDQELLTNTVESRYLGIERLAVNLDQFMYHANQPTIQFKELRGLSFLVLQDIGIWRDIIQDQIPDAQFMYQAQRDAFTKITKYADFPYFSTNLSPLDPDAPTVSQDDNRVRIPISDDIAKIPIYGSYLKEDRDRVAPVLEMMSQAWPQ